MSIFNLYYLSSFFNDFPASDVGNNLDAMSIFIVSMHFVFYND